MTAGHTEEDSATATIKTQMTMRLAKQDISDKVQQLLSQQKALWPLAGTGYEGLKAAATRRFSFDGFQIVVQFNPERIRSSTAKTDKETISRRPCLLCPHNRPSQQNGLAAGGYTILVNPYPIFSEHLTITTDKHLPQRIDPYFRGMLNLSSMLPGFTVFYNGPHSGASAPDHFHFQAGTKYIMPADTEAAAITAIHGELLFNDDSTTIHVMGSRYLRKFILLTSSSSGELEKHFAGIVNILEERGQPDEPMMNILCSHDNGKWQTLIFPRNRLRPRQFYANDNSMILVSPAAAEMGGLCVVPRKEDFEKITKNDLADIYSQVTINDADFNSVKQQIKRRYATTA